MGRPQVGSGRAESGRALLPRSWFEGVLALAACLLAYEGLLGRWPLDADLLMRSIDGLTVHGNAVLAFFHEVYVGVNNF